MVFLNGVVANLLAWEMVKLVSGCQAVYPYLYYDLAKQESFPVDAPRDPDCYLCGDSADSLLGTGMAGIRGFIQKRERSPMPLPRPPQASETA